jgi:hypothetical protein
VDFAPWLILGPVAAWNAVALGLGVIGWLRRDLRPRLAEATADQMRVAVFLVSCALVLSVVAFLLGIAFHESSFPVLLRAGLFFAALGWAAGAFVPFIVTIFLSARPRNPRDGRREPGAPPRAG